MEVADEMGDGMMFGDAPARVVVEVEDCPECHEVCEWCSWYRKNARAHGCGCPPPPRSGGRRKPCEQAEALKGTQCGTCDGSGKVMVRREYLVSPDLIETVLAECEGLADAEVVDRLTAASLGKKPPAAADGSTARRSSQGHVRGARTP